MNTPSTHSEYISSNQEKRIYFLGIGLLLILPNHDIINWLVSGTPLLLWKQILSLILLTLALRLIFKKKSLQNKDLNSIRKIFLLILFVTAFLSATALAQQLSIIRISYALIAYIGFIGGVAVSISIINLKSVLSFLKITSILGIFLSLGIIFDYFTGYLDFLPRASDDNDIVTQLSEGYLRRASFLFGTSTVVLPFLNFCFLASTIMLNSKKESSNYYFIALVLMPISIYLTGSRSQLILTMISVIFSITISYKNIFLRKNILFMILTIFSFLVVFLSYINTSYQSELLVERYLDTFNSDASGNDVRYEQWNKAIKLFTDQDIEIIIGSGIGSSMGMINDGYSNIDHYESSFFQAYAEAGYFGLFIRYFPLITSLYYLFKSGIKNRINLIFIAWFLIYFLSIFSAPTASAYHTQYVFFLMVGFSIQINRFKKSLN